MLSTRNYLRLAHVALEQSGRPVSNTRHPSLTSPSSVQWADGWH